MSKNRSLGASITADTQRSVIVVGAIDPSAITALFGAAQPCLDPDFRDVLPAKAELNDHTDVLVVEHRPGDAIGADIERGASPKDALERWMDEASQRLRAYRQLRRHIVVVDAVTLARRDRHVVEALAQRFGVTFPDDPAARRQIEPGTTLRGFVAAALIATNEDAQAIADEIGALQLGAEVEDPSVLFDTVDTAWSDLTDLRARADKSAALAELQATLGAANAEVAALRETVQGLQHEKDRLTRALEDKAAALPPLEAALADAQNVIRETGSTSEALTAERNLLRESLTALLADSEVHLDQARARNAEVEALRAEAADRNALRADCLALRQQVARADQLARMREAVLGKQILGLAADNSELEQGVRAVQSEIERVFASKSWALTDPLRRLSKLLPRSPR